MTFAMPQFCCTCKHWRRLPLGEGSRVDLAVGDCLVLGEPDTMPSWLLDANLGATEAGDGMSCTRWTPVTGAGGGS